MLLTNQKSKINFMPIASLVAILLLGACSQAEPQSKTVIISAEITVSADTDSTKDFSGVNFTIVSPRDEIARDTVLNAFTDIDGRFNVVARISERGTYPLVVSRNNRVLHITNIVLAPDDTIRIAGSIPDLNRNLRISSIENDAMATYERLQRLYGRVATFAYGGRVEADTIPGLMNQWSDYFWSLRTEYPGTYASELASVDAIEILEGWNDAVVMDRIQQLENREEYIPVKIIYGGHIKARLEGVDKGLNYLENLRGSMRNNDQRTTIDMRTIELLVDYQEFDRALVELSRLSARNNSDEQFQAWATSVKYELENLIPGREIPSFSLQISGNETISKEQLLGSYYMMEVVLLADANYQSVYPALNALFESIPNNLVKFYSLPLDNSQITINGFFEERTKRWSFSNAGALDQNDFLEILRIDQVPTRYLVNPDGIIISRYANHDITALQNDINTIIESKN
jgi:hypothetical protein